mgnify:FL=1
MAQTSICRGTATSVACENGRITVTYHKTMVVDVTPEHITLDTGGWKTATTKLRMNQAAAQFNLGYTVYQQKGRWFVRYRGITRQFDQDEIVLERV